MGVMVYTGISIDTSYRKGLGSFPLSLSPTSPYSVGPVSG